MAAYIFLALLAGILYGLSVFFEKEWAMAYVDTGIALTAIAKIIGGVMILPLIAVPSVTVPETSHLLLAVGIGIFFIFPLYTYYIALRIEDASLISITMRLSSVFTAVLAAIFLNQILPWKTYLGIGVVLVGVVLASIVSTDPDTQSVSPVGIGIAIFSTLLYAIGNLLIEIGIESMTMMTFLYWSRIGGMIVACLCCLFHPRVRQTVRDICTAPRLHGAGPVLLASSFGALGEILYIYATGLGPVAVVSPLSATESVFVLVFSMIWMYRSSFTIQNMWEVYGTRIGAVAIVLVGITLIN